MRPDKQQYAEMAKEASPKSKSYITVPKAFFIGGTICTLGQGLFNLWGKLGFDGEEASILVSVSLITLSALSTGFGFYDDIAKHAGAGTLVPITGFANAVVSPALEFKAEGFILGVGAKVFTIAGPVIMYGVLTSVLYGFIYWICMKL